MEGSEDGGDPHTGRAQGLEMWTVTFSPFLESWPGEPLPENQSLFRIIYLRNLSTDRIDTLSVGVQSALGGEVSDGTLTVVSENRRLRICPLGGYGIGEGATLVVPLELDPGEEDGLAFALTASSPSFPEEPALESLHGLTLSGVESRLINTIDAWQTWYAQGAQIETPDPRVNDLVEGLTITDKVSTTIAGGPVEISTTVWSGTVTPMAL